jgi:hypothetical protein
MSSVSKANRDCRIRRLSDGSVNPFSKLEEIVPVGDTQFRLGTLLLVGLGGLGGLIGFGG